MDRAEQIVRQRVQRIRCRRRIVRELILCTASALLTSVVVLAGVEMVRLLARR
jgi:hypothetical protein